MIKRKKLGQHFLNSQSIASQIVSHTSITENDVVYEIGTGLGILTPMLCRNAKKVISVEADKKLYLDAQKKFSGISNLTLKFGDGFKINPPFSIFVSNLPYSKSKEAIEFLASSKFSHGIIMVQKEFAEKIFPNSEKKQRAICVVANFTLEIQKILKVGKKNFSPPPKIDSVILKINKKRILERNLIKIINKIFSYKRKKISNILKQFGIISNSDQRLDDLSIEEIVDLAKKIAKQ